MKIMHTSKIIFLVIMFLSCSQVYLLGTENPGIQGSQKAVKVTFNLSPHKVRYDYINNKRIEKPVFGYNPSADVIRNLEAAGFSVIREANQKYDLVLKIVYDEKEAQSPQGEFINSTTAVVAYFDFEVQDKNGKAILKLMGSHGQPEIPSEAKKFINKELAKMIKGRLQAPDEVTFLISIHKQGRSLGRPVKMELVRSNTPLLRRLGELQDARTTEVFVSFLRSYSATQRGIARSALLKLGYKPPEGTEDEAAFEMVNAISGNRKLHDIIISYGSPAIERIIEDLKCLYIMRGQHWYGGGQISEIHPDLVLKSLTEENMRPYLQRTIRNEKGQYVKEKKEWKQEWNDTAVRKLIEVIAAEHEEHESFKKSNSDLENKSLYDLVIDVLGEIADRRAIEPLKKYLAAHPESATAKEAIIKIGDPQAVEQIIADLKDNEKRVREIAASALGKIGDSRAIEPLISALNDDSDSVRVLAAKALGKIDDPRVVEPLMDALKNNSVELVRVSAVEALGKTGDSRAVESLIAAMKDRSERVRELVVEALGKTGDPRAVEPLIYAWRYSGYTIKEKAAEVLQGIKEKQGAELFLAPLKSSDSKVRENTARVLDELGWSPESDIQKALYLIAKNKWSECIKIGKPVVESLMFFISQGDGNTRTRAAEALAEIGDPRALESLMAALTDEDIFVRQYAARGLGKIGDSRAVEPLIATLKDKNLYVRVDAAAALGKMRDSRAMEPLILALGDADYRVKNSTYKALKEITGQDFSEQKKWQSWWKKNKKKFIPSR